jgi:hypothetical protein
MFANEYQGGTHVELLGTQGQNPLASWRVSGPHKGVQKLFDKVSSRTYRLHKPARASKHRA